MPWFKVDDKLHSHMKIAEAGPAMALWVVAGSWSADQLTDGFVPLFMCKRLMPGGADMADVLVDVGLWSEDCQDGRDGFQFKDWDDYQPTAEDVEAKRAAARERMRRVREDRKRTEGSSSRDVRANTQRSNASSSPNPVPDPTRPEPEDQTLGADAPREDGLTHQQIVDRLGRVCGLTPPWPKSEAGRVAKAAKELRDMGLESLDLVDAKARAYRRKWPDIDMTPQALVGNWSQLDSDGRQQGGSRRPPPVEAIA